VVQTVFILGLVGRIGRVYFLIFRGKSTSFRLLNLLLAIASCMASKLHNPQKTLERLRLIGMLEGISYLVLLFIAMPIKYVWQDPYWVKQLGMIHGVLFVFYVLLLLMAWYDFKFSWWVAFWIFVLSLVPFGTFYSDKKFLKQYSI